VRKPLFVFLLMTLLLIHFVSAEDLLIQSDEKEYLLVSGEKVTVLLEADNTILQKLGFHLSDVIDDDTIQSLTLSEADLQPLRFVLDTLGANGPTQRGEILQANAHLFEKSDITTRLKSLGLPADNILARIDKKGYSFVVVDATEKLSDYNASRSNVAVERLGLWLQDAKRSCSEERE